MNHPKVFLPVLVIAAGIGLALLIFSTRPQVEARPPESVAPLVRVVSVSRGPVSLAVHTHGTIEPRTESALVPEVSGLVVWVSPHLVSGGYFEKGEALLRIDPIDFEVALERARADLARAESEDSRARKELGRQRTLAEQNVASTSRVDDAENAAKVSSAVLRHGKAVLRKARRDLARAEMQAPYRGRVREERVDLGQFVSRGSPIATIYAVDYAEVRLPIADEELAYLDLGLRPGEVNGEGPAVTLRARFAGRERSWQGRVVRTEGEIDPQSRMVRVVAQIEDPLGKVGDDRAPLEVGLFVDAEIQGRTLEDAVVLPREALRNGHQVFVVDSEGRLRFREVEVARVERDQVVVRSGLAAGEQVCISPLATAVDGMIVRIAPATRQEAGS